MTTTLEISSDSPDQTIEIGQLIASILRCGDIVALVGQLGAGKTQLTKGIALGLGVSDSRLVNSPTFVLVNEYSGSVPVHHIDAYRLNSAAEFEALGFDEMVQGGVVIVEWADRVADALFNHAFWIELCPVGASKRMISLTAAAPESAARLANLGSGD